jgi:hypothetical protein
VPRIEADVMVVATGGDEGGLIPHSLPQLEAEDAAVEADRAIEIGDLQMDVTDVDARIDRHAPDRTPADAAGGAKVCASSTARPISTTSSTASRTTPGRLGGSTS